MRNAYPQDYAAAAQQYELTHSYRDLQTAAAARRFGLSLEMRTLGEEMVAFTFWRQQAVEL